MNFHKFKKMLMEKHPDIPRIHGEPRTRRELLSQGFISYSTLALGPSILSMVSTEAYGACDLSAAGGDETPVAFIIDMAGGIRLPRNFIVGDRAGNPLSAASYHTLGIGVQGATEQQDFIDQVENADRSMGTPINPISEIGQALQADTSEATRNRTESGILATITDDDTGNNPSNPVYMISSMLTGQVTTVVSNTNSESGGRSTFPEQLVDPGKRPVQVRTGVDAQNLVLPGKLQAIVGKPGLEKILRTAQGMSKAQLAKFHAKALPQQLREMLECNGLKGTEQLLNFDATQVDPANDPIIQRTMLNQGTNPTGFTSQSLAAASKLALDGYAKVVVHQIGGCDYHGNGEQRTTDKDRQVGRTIAAIMEAAAAKQKNVAIFMITDGGIASRVETGNRATNYNGYLPSSDNGIRSLMSMIFVKGAGQENKIEMTGMRQIGAYKDGGNIDADADKVSNSPAFASKVLAANFWSFAGKSRAEIEVGLGERFEANHIIASAPKKD